jgi:hypothetical protein
MKNITTIIHKATVTQDIRGSPQCGLCPTTLLIFYYLLTSFLQPLSIKTLLHEGQEICVHLARFSFPKLGYSTNPSTVYTQASYNHLHLPLKVFNTTCTKHSQLLSLSPSAYNITHFFPLLTSPSYLFIHYKRS